MKKTVIGSAIGAFAILTACGGQTSETTPAEPAVTAEAPAETAETSETLLDIALMNDMRSEAERARDEFRHPKETLEFFSIEPDDKVVEIWPGGGWYTNILAPYLAAEGTLVLAGFDPNSTDDPDRKAIIEQRNAALKENYSDPKFAGFEYSAFSNVSGALTEPDTADAILSFRNVHNWMAGGYADKFFTDAYAALKPGGVLGIVEHRLPSTATQDPQAPTGYVHEDYVKGLALAAGFEFVEASEINANPNDTADHPFGVWTLPPNNSRGGEDAVLPEGFDDEAIRAIGESDRMTLKFVKPMVETNSAVE